MAAADGGCDRIVDVFECVGDECGDGGEVRCEGNAHPEAEAEIRGHRPEWRHERDALPGFVSRRGTDGRLERRIQDLEACSAAHPGGFVRDGWA